MPKSGRPEWDNITPVSDNASAAAATGPPPTPAWPGQHGGLAGRARRRRGGRGGGHSAEGTAVCRCCAELRAQLPPLSASPPRSLLGSAVRRLSFQPMFGGPQRPIMAASVKCLTSTQPSAAAALNPADAPCACKGRDRAHLSSHLCRSAAATVSSSLATVSSAPEQGQQKRGADAKSRGSTQGWAGGAECRSPPQLGTLPRPPPPGHEI